MALSNNGKKILIWSTLITMLGVGGYYGYKWFIGRDKPKDDKPKEDKIKEDNAEDPSPTTTGQNAINDSQPFKTEAEVKAFQKWVINIKGDKTILGKGGEKIKEISSEARHDIGEIAGAKVHLFLFVKTKKDWMNDSESYEIMDIEKVPNRKKTK
jgi:hypothetical protein